MKLLRAEFQNFRLIRDLSLEFSSDPDRNLTVIRAANESGKTTILHGLQWALYGDSALPGKGEGFRLHPIDWEVGDGKRVPITATVEFALTTHRRVGGELRETRRRFRLVRSAFEEVDSQARRGNPTRRALRSQCSSRLRAVCHRAGYPGNGRRAANTQCREPLPYPAGARGRHRLGNLPAPLPDAMSRYARGRSMSR